MDDPEMVTPATRECEGGRRNSISFGRQIFPTNNPTNLFDQDGPESRLRPLRPHQESAIDALRRSFADGYRRPLIQAPTGFGKTLTAAHVIVGVLKKQKRVIFTVPALSLIDQTVQAFWDEGIRCIGVMQADHIMTDPSQPVQVASVQTLARRKIPPADLVLIDEAHKKFQSISEWMASEEWRHVPFVGLSATPWTRGLGKDYDKLIVAATTADLIDKGYLSKFVVYAPTPEPDLRGVATTAGDYNQSQLGEAVDQIELVADIVETWLKLGENRQTLCFGVNRKHAEHICERFIEAGVPAEYVDCFTSDDDRQKIIGRFKRGETRIICNVGVLTTGFDADVRCIVDAKPTMSNMLFVQTIGRSLRPAPGKDNLLILDHAGNHLRLGLVTDIHHETLDDGMPRRAGESDRERKAPLPRLCDNCKAVIPRGVKSCPQCGCVIEAKTDVLVKDGNLVKLGSRQSGEYVPSFVERVVFYAELVHIAQERGYARGWVAHKYREKFGMWPDFGHVEPITPSLKTKQWVRSRAIAYAKGKAVAHG